MALDLYQQVTDRIIEAMENGTAPWVKGWNAPLNLGMPMRSNGEPYRGINVLLLWSAAMAKGFESDIWMTFKQAKEKGGQVRKGEKGTHIVFFKQLQIEDKQTGEDKKIPMLKGYTVFNLDQIDGIDKPAPVKPIESTGTIANAELDSFFASTGAIIKTEGNQPAYYPQEDCIRMPAITKFNSAGEYYSTLAHELIHWTGHRTRLNRLGYSKPEYAFEELVAELGSLFVGHHAGIDTNIDNSAAYIQSWLRALKNDKKFIFKAATGAQAATDWVLEKAARPIAQAA